MKEVAGILGVSPDTLFLFLVGMTAIAGIFGILALIADFLEWLTRPERRDAKVR